MFGGCEVMITPPGILGKAESPSGALKGGRNRQLVAPRRRNTLLCSHLGAPLPSFASLLAFHTSRWRGRRPQPRDQRQDIGEHLSRHRSSSGGEFHPSALTKPDVRLSPHLASIFQPTDGYQSATNTRGSDLTARAVLANVQRRFFDIATACISVSPIGRAPR
jgi:hypothetical protein